MLIQARHGHSLNFFKNYLFLFGGMAKLTNEKNDIFILDISNNTWKLIEDISIQKRDPS